MAEKPRRAVCVRCTRPVAVCYCVSLPLVPLVTEWTHVLVLQHPHESQRRTAISSVPVLARTLANVTVVTVDKTCDCGRGKDHQLDALLYDGTATFDCAMILFPIEHAQPVRTEFEAKTRRVLLIVIDGTWKQAKKIVYRNRHNWEIAAKDWTGRGASLQYIRLDREPKRSIYDDLRREPMASYVSTLEAVASTLLRLESDTSGRHVYDALVRAFQGMVSIQKEFHQRGRQATLKQYGGIPKAEAIAKRLELAAANEQR